MISLLTVATSALFSSAVAGPHDGHQVYHNKVRGLGESTMTCGCTTYYTTFIGTGTCTLHLKRMLFGVFLTDRRIAVVQDIQPNSNDSPQHQD